MNRIAVLMFSAVGVLLTMQSDASAWMNLKFSAGVNFHMERGPNRHNAGCPGGDCGMPMSYGSPMSYGAPIPQGIPQGDQGAIAPPANSFGQAPANYSNFYPASYQSYPGAYQSYPAYYPNYYYGR